jgi:heme/copper-type cytochrome/quinol oxidase subunit 3
VASRIFWYYLFSIYVLFGVLFYLFFVLLISRRYYLDAVNFGNLQDYQEEDFEQQQVGYQGKCSLTMLILYAFSL